MAHPETVHLWPHLEEEFAGAATERLQEDRGDGISRIAEVFSPTITVYPAPWAKDPAPAVVICPGGGYWILAIDHEGTEIAEWLNSIGITAVLLRYRVPNVREEAFADAQRAMRLVRHHAGRWNINPGKIGILGFSAGGHLAARTTINHEQMAYPAIDEVDETPVRPDFTVLVYPAYLNDQEHPDRLAPELQFGPEADLPPFFILQTKDDSRFVDGTRVFDAALTNGGVRSDLHLFSVGGHGYGLRESPDPVSHWGELCAHWLRRIVKDQN